MSDVDYSIVVPVYFNEGSLKELEAELRGKVLEVVQYKGEIVFIDDGSRDCSFEIMRELQRAQPDDVRVFKLSRNFGQSNALWCGFENTPSTIVMISADGQDPVETIPKMLRKHFDEGYEVVIAKRDSREETFFRRLTSKVVYWLMRRLSNSEMPVGGFDFVLLGDKAKKALIKVYQPHTFMQARMLDLGFKRAWIGYHRCDRKHGQSRWTFAKKFTYMLDGVLGHSYLPIRMMSLIGAGFSLISLLFASYFLINYLTHGHVLKGWTPIILAVLFVGGVQMMMIGVIGEYLWRVLAQVRQTPPYIVEEVLDSELS
jgi:glycosyltransferase involved in cell wall biosynthesis